MGEVTIDSIQIEIESNFTNASKGLDALAETLGQPIYFVYILLLLYTKTAERLALPFSLLMLFDDYSRTILVIPRDALPSACIIVTRRSISFCGSLISSAIEF